MTLIVIGLTRSPIPFYPDPAVVGMLPVRLYPSPVIRGIARGSRGRSAIGSRSVLQRIRVRISIIVIVVVVVVVIVVVVPPVVLVGLLLLLLPGTVAIGIGRRIIRIIVISRRIGVRIVRIAIT